MKPLAVPLMPTDYFHDVLIIEDITNARRYYSGRYR